MNAAKQWATGLAVLTLAPLASAHHGEVHPENLDTWVTAGFLLMMIGILLAAIAARLDGGSDHAEPDPDVESSAQAAHGSAVRVRSA
ncbi:MAG: hypothetical protein AAGI72_01570 [Pseudomonadota bacterium]